MRRSTAHLRLSTSNTLIEREPVRLPVGQGGEHEFTQVVVDVQPIAKTRGVLDLLALGTKPASAQSLQVFLRHQVMVFNLSDEIFDSEIHLGCLTLEVWPLVCCAVLLQLGCHQRLLALCRNGYQPAPTESYHCHQNGLKYGENGCCRYRGSAGKAGRGDDQA